MALTDGLAEREQAFMSHRYALLHLQSGIDQWCRICARFTSDRPEDEILPSQNDRLFLIERAFEQGLHVRSLSYRRPRGTIFYIHGLGESALSFERLMTDPRLARWDHVAVDLVGYGKSGWAPEPLTLDEHVERLGRYLDAYHTDPPVILGHSMGGVLGILFCERFGDRVRAFVNVEGNITLPDCGYSSRAVKYSRGEWLGRGLGEVLDGIYSTGEERIEVRRAYAASIHMCDPRAYHLNSGELVEASRGETLAERMAALEMPALYVHGAPRGTCEGSLKQLARAGVRTVYIHDAGHWPFLDQPDAFGEALHGFLEEVSAP